MGEQIFAKKVVCMQTRGQVSTELLLLIGVMLLLMVPLLLYSRSRADMAGEEIATQKAEFAAQRIVSMADSVGYLGGAAKVVEELDVPPNLVRAYTSGHDVVFELDTSTGRKEIVKSSAFNLASSGLGNISKAGTYFVEISAMPPSSPAQVKIELK